MAKDPTIKDMLAAYKKEEAERQKKAKKELKQIGAELFLLGVARVVGEYSGEGDSGDMETISYFDINNEPVKSNKKITEHKEQLIQCLWQFIPSGFENNEGGFGEVDFEIAQNRVMCKHNERITETNYTETEETL